MKKIKFLFDLGNVFFDWDPRHFYKDVFSNINEMEYFLSEICNDKWNIQQDAGRTIEEAEKDLIPLFPKYQDKIKLYYKNHGKMIKGVFETSIELLEELKKQNYSPKIRFVENFVTNKKFIAAIAENGNKYWKTGKYDKVLFSWKKWIN